MMQMQMYLLTIRKNLKS